VVVLVLVFGGVVVLVDVGEIVRLDRVDLEEMVEEMVEEMEGFLVGDILIDGR